MLRTWSQLNRTIVLKVGQQPFRIGTTSNSLRIITRNYKPLLAVSYRRQRIPWRSASHPHLDRIYPFLNPAANQQSRNFFVGRIIRGALKIRYLLLTGAVGGGLSLQQVKFDDVGQQRTTLQGSFLSSSSQSYEKWKENLPDTQWIQDLFPSQKVDAYRESLMNLSAQFRESLQNIDIGTSTIGPLSLSPTCRSR